MATPRSVWFWLFREKDPYRASVRSMMDRLNRSRSSFSIIEQGKELPK